MIGLPNQISPIVVIMRMYQKLVQTCHSEQIGMTGQIMTFKRYHTVMALHYTAP